MPKETPLSPPESSTLALVRDENARLTDEQRARKAWLLSRFRNFAQGYGGIPDYADQPHDEMCDYLELVRPNIGHGSQQQKELYLAPRYTYKTSLEKAYMTYLILFFREYGVDISIDYVRSSLDLAQDVLFELKTDFERLPTIRELWPELANPKNWLLWSANRINISGRRDNTIAVSGLDRGAAGKHPDIVIMDDMVNEKNYNSIKAKRAANVKLQSYYPILPKWGALIVSGTRFAHNDVYGRILSENAKDRKKHQELLAAGKTEEAAKHKPQWIEYIRRSHNRDGELFAPTLLPEEFLAQQKRSIEAKFYASWYDNSPDVEGMVRFKLDYLRYFNATLITQPIPMLELIDYDKFGHAYPIEQPFPVRVTMTLDPTLTAQQTSDRTGISVNATDANGHWWLLHAKAYLLVPSEITRVAIELIDKYRPAVLRIEAAMADPNMVARIQTAIIERGYPTVITSYSALLDETHASGRRKKNARIEAQEPRFRNGGISWHRGTCDDLYDQYVDWPDVDHDDVFDAVAMQDGISKKCQYKTVSEFMAQQVERDDDEPGWSGQISHTLYDRWGTPVLVTADVENPEGARVFGRVGMGSQRLAAR